MHTTLSIPEGKADGSLSFLMTFQSDFLYQGGSKDAVAYIAVKYANDSVCASVTHFSMNGTNQIRINPCDEKVKEVTTFFYLGDGSDQTPNLRLLFLSHIQLIRFHQKTDDTKPAPAAAAEDTDIAKPVPDSLRPRPHRLGERPIEMKDVKPITQRE